MDNTIPGLNIPAYIEMIRNPYDTQNVFDLIRTMGTSGQMEKISQTLRAQVEKDEGLRTLYKERYCPRYLTNEELLEHPENSLGRRLGEHLARHKITLEFQGIDMSQIYDQQQDLFDYARLRALRVHDIVHTLLGADTSPIGEGVVGAFLSVQYGAAFHAINISNICMHIAFFDNTKLMDWNYALTDALVAGRKCTPVYGVPWESLFAEDIDILRARFNICTSPVIRSAENVLENVGEALSGRG